MNSFAIVKVMQPTSSVLIDVKDVSYQPGTHLILDNINVKVHAGDILSIVGPNGAGKTTLIKTMIGLIAPTQGVIYQKPNLRIGYMPQRIPLDPNFPLTVKRFLTLGQSDVDMAFIVKEVGIESRLDCALQTLSGGELQRVLLARALLRKPELLVLDEPAQGVDLMGQSDLYDLIARIRDHYHCGIVLVSHDLNVVMAQTDIVVCLNQHICCQGHPEKVTQDPAFAHLFGDIARTVALYTHRHDHHHEPHGMTHDKDCQHE